MNSDEKINKVLVLEDFEEASEALLSLKYNMPDKAKELALDILNGNKGDVFFQAFAFEVLYGVDRNAAIDYIERNLNKTKMEVYRAMLECVTEDSGIATETPEIQKAVDLLDNHTRYLTAQDLDGLSDTLNWFKESYGR